MKKMALCIIPLIMAIMGCASSGKAAAETKSSSVGMDFDAAIKEAAAQMETNIPSKTMVALVSVASPSTAFSTQVLTRLESAIVSGRKLVVVDRANLDKIREEQGFQLSGEVDDESAKSIGKLLGAGAIVTGSLTDLGDVYSLTLKAINIETATVAVSYLADLAKGARVETLLASGGGTKTAVTKPGMATQVAPTATSTPNPASPRAQPTAQSPAEPAPVQTAQSPTPAVPAPPREYKIGDRGPGGGIIFYDKGRVINGWQYLEAAPANTELTAEWGLGRQPVEGTQTGIGAGKRNTELILEKLRSTGEVGRAAELCDEVFAGRLDDWFLPSKDELDLMYKNLKVKGLGGFGTGYYWSSSTNGDDIREVWAHRFDGNPDRRYRSETFSVRAIRQF